MQDPRLSKIETAWSIVRRAHGDETAVARNAQHQLLEQYGTAIQRYLLGALRDPVAADDVYQDFSLRFIRGDFRAASQDRGRFRSFLKTCLFRMVADHYRSEKRSAAAALDSQLDVPDDSNEADERERQFLQVWRDDMLKRTWDALALKEKESGKPWFTVMRARVANPKLRSQELANLVTDELGKPISSANLRVILHRARERFSDLLIACVADSLATSDVHEIEQELAELGLLEYCQSSLEARRRES